MLAKLLADHRCEFSSEGEFCEACKAIIPEAAPVYCFSDGGEQPENTYVCGQCASDWLTPAVTAATRRAEAMAEINEGDNTNG